MIMNKFINKIMAIGATGLLLFSCSESFLDVEPQTSIFDENFYKTEADAEMALIGCYDGYQRTSSNGSVAFYVTSEVLSDDCFSGLGNTDQRNYCVIDRFDISQSQSDNNIFNNTWADYYAGIFRCNTLLKKLPAIADWKSSSDSLNSLVKKRIEGETRFLRAIMYFDLVRLFDKVPLLTEPTTANIPQSEAVETYKLIVEDLKFAAANIPASSYPKANAAENDGRVTCHAAKALLARVYLFYKGYYGKEDIGVTKAEALAGLEDIITSNEFALVQDYKALWPAASYKLVTKKVGTKDTTVLDKSDYAGKGNIETVFAQKFNNTQNYNGMMDGNRWLVMMGMRNTNWSPYGKGWGCCTVNPKFVSSYAPGDTRKTASIIDIVGENIKSTFDIKDQREYTGFTVKKYSPTSLPDGTSDTGGSNDFQTSQDQDFVVVRYADVLLMAAELGSPNALQYFNMVHTRAGLTALTSAPSLDQIMEERHFEFAFEGLRYWDLLRQGLTKASNTIAATSQTLLSGGNNDVITISATNVTKTKGFMQIPNTQITLSNGVLVQNAGW
jgi:hypothetical protein